MTGRKKNETEFEECEIEGTGREETEREEYEIKVKRKLLRRRKMKCEGREMIRVDDEEREEMGKDRRGQNNKDEKCRKEGWEREEIVMHLITGRPLLQEKGKHSWLF